MTCWVKPVPSEEDEQRVVAEWLDRHGVCWYHPMNEGKHKPQYRRKQAQLGLKAGVPDIIILDPPTAHKNKYCGTAIELKRRDGKNRPTKRQKEWLQKLADRGWYTAVCYGADEAIRLCEKLGYGGKRND